MTGRARTAASALRSRVAVVLAVGLIGPLFVVAAGLSLWARDHAPSHAHNAALRDARAAQLALVADCAAVTDVATATARQVQQYAAVYDPLSEVAAQAAADSTVAHHPEAAVAIFDRDWKILAVAGSDTGRRPVEAAGYGASCSKGLPGSNQRVAGLSERQQVRTAEDGLVASVVLWFPVDDAALGKLRSGLGGQGHLSVLGAGDRVVASSDPHPAGRLAGAVRDADAEGEDDVGTPGRAGTARVSRGVASGLGYAVLPAAPGSPFRLVATTPVASFGPARVLALAALAVGLIALLPIRSLAGRLSGPVTEELHQATGELHTSQVTLARTLTTFGEALEHTHDLEALLDTVTEVCRHGSGAVAAVALLTDDGPGAGSQPAGGPRPLTTRGSSVAPGSELAAAPLPALAERWFRQPGSDPLLSRVESAGPVLVVGIHSAGRLIGVLALAQGEAGTGFDALALPRVQAVADHAGTAVANVRLHEEVRRLSVTDPLTGVGNVRQLTTTLSKELAGAIRYDNPLTVLMLDLDHFKRVNDTLGHQFGDMVLREFANRLLGCVRELDSVTRYGGEEFAVVLRDTDTEGGCIVAERVLRQVREEPFHHGDLWQAVTVSIGVASFPVHGRTPADVLRAADQALYTAKREGRDRCQVAPAAPGTSAISQAG